ncbi:MAG: EMC3/TMCO1 family protein, partial [Candidatus Hadarchaeota archaeon]|nr:EMC3/TMCO1 family protein [Candidatus Hadarchaeota archaeon]
LAAFATTVSAGDDRGEAYKQLLREVDGSISTLRKGGDPSGALSNAEDLYKDNLVTDENFEGSPTLAELDTDIRNAFDSLGGSATEEDIRALRSDISQMADKLGISLPFIYEHAMFTIFGLSLLIGFVVTLINKHTVDWGRVKQAKAKMKAWQKELRAAHREKDMKRIHKLKSEQEGVMEEQKEVMMATFKPMIFYIIPYFLMWWWLSGIFSGWVVAWLPFNLPLPFFGTIASMGFLGWYLISYFGFSQLWRRFLIGD